MPEYVGAKCEVSRDADGLGTMKITQPVLIQKLKDMVGEPNRPVRTPALAGEVLVRGDGSGALTDPSEITRYRSITAINMYIGQWSRAEIQNATRGCARMMQAPRAVHEKALTRLAQYCVCTPNRGLVLRPDRMWDGSINHKFRIHGRSDSDYAANTDDRRSVTGARVFLENCPVIFRSVTQKFVTLSVTKAETAAGVTCAQDMMYVYRILTSLGLEVQLPMVLRWTIRVQLIWPTAGASDAEPVMWTFACTTCAN